MVKVVDIVRTPSTTLDLDRHSDTFRCFDHRSICIGDEFDSAIQLPGELQIDRHGKHCSMHDAVYSARLALFIRGIMSAKKAREVRPVLAVLKPYLSEKVALSF